jgi:hypothetical protein
MALILLWTAPSASAQTPEDPDAVVKEFVVSCGFSHRNSDDPIVYPGVPGAAHSHDFFGNGTTDAASTYESLRTAGDRRGDANTTCTRDADTAAYWMPTLQWNGKTLRAINGLFYYRSSLRNAEEVGSGLKNPAEVVPHPAGLKVVSDTHVSWRCARGQWGNDPPARCSNGELVVRVVFPDCWNGVDLDSADHRSHMAYAALQSDGTAQCPSTHPISVPVLSMQIRFKIGTSPGTATLSSGAHTTMHADFFNAWDQAEYARLVNLCISDPYPLGVKPEECTFDGQ